MCYRLTVRMNSIGVVTIASFDVDYRNRKWVWDGRGSCPST